MSGPITAKVANKFELSGNGTTISYSSTGPGGKPSLSYKDGKFNMQFSGDQIRTEDSELGELVTVTLAGGGGGPEPQRHSAHSGHRSGERQFPTSDYAGDPKPAPRWDPCRYTRRAAGLRPENAEGHREPYRARDRRGAPLVLEAIRLLKQKSRLLRNPPGENQ